MKNSKKAVIYIETNILKMVKETDGDWSHEIQSHLLLGSKAMTDLDNILKKQRHYFTNKGPSSQGYGFSSGHVWI